MLRTDRTARPGRSAGTGGSLCQAMPLGLEQGTARTPPMGAGGLLVSRSTRRLALPQILHGAPVYGLDNATWAYVAAMRRRTGLQPVMSSTSCSAAASASTI